MQSPLHKKNLFRLVTFLLPLLLLFFAGEVLLRVLGFTPFSPSPEHFVVEPGSKFYTRHPRLGYTLMVGHFRVSLPDGYSFEVTHSENTNRITHRPEDNDRYRDQKGIWIFGCSFTHGWGLNDSETYPWLLQEKLPDYEVVNFGVEGYGTIQSLIQFQEALQQRKPEVAIIAYASFHDERNTFSRQVRKLAVVYNRLGPTVQPYARLDQNNNLNHYFADTDQIKYVEFPFMRYSSLLSYLEVRYNQVDAFFNRSHEVSKAIIREFAGIAKRNNIRLVVAGIFSDSQTHDMLEYCKSLRIHTLDMSVDMTKRENTNWPHDLHPSVLATRQYADGLFSFLTNEVRTKSHHSSPASFQPSTTTQTTH